MMDKLLKVPGRKLIDGHQLLKETNRKFIDDGATNERAWQKIDRWRLSIENYRKYIEKCLSESQ